MSARRGIFLAPFEALSEPELLADLAATAEAQGWDGVFLWDHVAYRGDLAVADPWVALAAIACATERVRIGPLVTPLSRRRVQKLARETVTLDRLSRGRLTLGVGLGVPDNGELEPFGEVVDARERARLLDDGLERLTGLWAGGFTPPPLQQPRIPVWAAARWPNRRPVRRAARWDGLFPIGLPGPEALATLGAEAAGLGADLQTFDLIVDIAPGEDPAPWAQAGATWVLTGFGRHPQEDEVRAAIAAGPS